MKNDENNIEVSNMDVFLSITGIGLGALGIFYQNWILGLIALIPIYFAIAGIFLNNGFKEKEE